MADRPREKLTRAGVAALGDSELIALVIGSGTRARGALEVARDLLERAGGADGLLRLTADELCGVDGIGAARAARLLAAVELGRRALACGAGTRPRFTSPQAIGRYLMTLYGGHRVERFGVLLLDTRLQLIRTAILTTGSADGVVVEPRDVYREAILASATCVVAFHNHPSGDPEPSPDDASVTARLQAAGEIVGVRLLDHIILGAGRYYSFKARDHVL